jgi:hypothetical protein
MLPTSTGAAGRQKEGSIFCGGVLSLLLFLSQSAPCDHGVKGETAAVDLDAVARSHKAAAKQFEVLVEKAAGGDPLALPFDAGLPACRSRETRRVKVAPLPRDLVGKVIGFGTEGEVKVVTKAKSLRDAAGGVLGSRELAGRLGVRCVPARVTARSETEVEIVEE